MPDWTEARRKAFVISVLRSGMRRFPNKYKALSSACVGVRLNKSSGRQAKHYKCAKCRKLYPSSNVQVDHIIPVVGPEGFTSFDTYIDRLFCSEDNLQVLCRECHKEKTSCERTARMYKVSKSKTNTRNVSRRKAARGTE